MHSVLVWFTGVLFWKIKVHPRFLRRQGCGVHFGEKLMCHGHYLSRKKKTDGRNLAKNNNDAFASMLSKK